MSVNNRMKRAVTQAERVQQAGKYANKKCIFFDCLNPTRAATKSGLDVLYCRKHAEHYQRHGSYKKGSYTASQLAPYRRSAAKWIKQHKDSLAVTEALVNINRLYWQAGRKVEATRLSGMKPKERAVNAWARLRVADIETKRVLAALLAVEHLCKVDPERSAEPEFKTVQVAKLVHRMASGTHKSWQQGYYGSGKLTTIEMHKYPQSRGRVLRHIGEQLQEAGYMAVDAYMEKQGVSPVVMPPKRAVRKPSPVPVVIPAGIVTDTTGAAKVELINGTLVVKW